ncbi:uncharacterized protein LOC119603237 [Lucilia sericata]|uniref:uncharacterized protein LOC119603237 n=1 Tax=Lucilia sericata TaxID=13632 RepID=UPI0018A85F19|nr:uncharacterized protein LOC119603237 [Lucilia sericata]
MPEVHVVIPPLQIPSENCSEMENSSTSAEVTDRSTNSHNDDRQLDVNKKKYSVESQSKNKLRKSYGRRFQRKTQMRPLGSQQKATSVLQQKSYIPRRLALTPSSSNTSLTTNDSLPSPLIPIVKTPRAEIQLETKISSRSCLVRQKSGIIFAFRQRKSISQMDFRHVQRQMNNLSISTSPMHLSKDSVGNSKALLPADTSGENRTVAYPQNSFVHKLYNQDSYFLTRPERDPQMAGMRIFATIMLNAWRKRRDEVKHLMEEVADLKRSSIKAKNQLHVFNTLFRVEQKRNDELNCQLKRSLDDINLTKSSCESLTTSLISLKADKALLEQQLQIKEQEFESLNTLLTQTKSDLFKSMTVQRELQASLSMEQRKIQTLENQKNELINEICELNSEALQKEDGLRSEIQEKSNEFSKLKNKLNEAQEQIKILKRTKDQELSEVKNREDRLKQDLETLESELKLMQTCLEATFGNRLKNCWNHSVTYQKFTLQMLHWLAYYLLPATPPPKMKALPFGLSLDKALSIVKR